MLTVVKSLLDEFHEVNITYCHWKSNGAIGGALSGEGDLDILVSQADASVACQVLCRLGFKRLTEPAGKAYPGIEHWLGYSEGESVFSHVHLHFRLLYGEQFIKGQRFRDEEGILRRRVFIQGIYQIRPADEMVLLFIRSILKVDFLWVLKKLSGVERRYFPTHILAEYGCLGQRLRSGELEEASEELAPGIRSSSLVDAVGKIADLGLFDIWRWRRRLRKELVFARRYSRIEHCAKFVRAYTELFLLKLHVAKKMKKQVYSGGMTVALLGADGAGKSSMVKELEKWLGRYLDVETVYVGTGDGKKGIALAVFDGAMMARNRRRKGKGEGSASRIRAKSWRSALGVSVGNIRAVLIARHRRSTVLRAQRYCNNGKIVFYDRFPQPFQRDYCDGPKIVRQGGALTSRLYRWEQRLYEELFSQFPDHCVVLMVDPGVSVARNRENQEATILAKNKVLGGLIEGRREHTIVVDANNDYGTVLSQLKKEVWAWL